MAKQKAAPAPDTRRLEYMPLGDVKPALKNPKLHHEDIDKSMGRFGYTEPVILDERTGRLVAGHGRLAALKKLRQQGAAPPAGIKLGAHGEAEDQGFDDDEWLIPVLRGWASADDREAEAYLIASNRLVEAGGWDDAVVAEMLEALAGSDQGLAGIGFTEREVASLTASQTMREVGKTPEELLVAFEEAAIRQVVLYFEGPEHRAFLDDLERVRQHIVAEHEAEFGAFIADMDRVKAHLAAMNNADYGTFIDTLERVRKKLKLESNTETIVELVARFDE